MKSSNVGNTATRHYEGSNNRRRRKPLSKKDAAWRFARSIQRLVERCTQGSKLMYDRFLAELRERFEHVRELKPRKVLQIKGRVRNRLVTFSFRIADYLSPNQATA